MALLNLLASSMAINESSPSSLNGWCATIDAECFNPRIFAISSLHVVLQDMPLLAWRRYSVAGAKVAAPDVADRQNSLLEMIPRMSRSKNGGQLRLGGLLNDFGPESDWKNTDLGLSCSAAIARRFRDHPLAR